MDEQRWLTFGQFEDRVGQPFEVGVPGAAPVAIRLADARESPEPGGRGPDGQPRKQFSVIFRGPRDPVLPQATYAVRHDELGDLDLFLVPVGRDDDGTTYEAAFA